MSESIPATSYSTIFHCDQSGFICLLRLLEGLVSVGMFYLFVQGYRVMKEEQNNKLSAEDRRLYMLAMLQTALLAVYYLFFEEFFMLATIRNLLLWIGINVLQILCLLNWDDKVSVRRGEVLAGVLQTVNFLLWFFISLGDGSSLVNTDFNLGYNCMIRDWMVMSGLLLVLYAVVAMLASFKVDQLNFYIANLQQTQADSRKLASARQEKLSIVLLACSGLAGAAVMLGWDYLAHRQATDRLSCERVFSGDDGFRNVLCFLLKLITMQLNPSVIYYIMYYSRREEFRSANEEKLLPGDYDIDYFDDGASDMNRTVSSRRSFSQRLPTDGRDNLSEYH
jgi:hypothetical protein